MIDSKSYTLDQGKGDASYRYMFIDNTSMNDPETIISKKYRTNINVTDGIWGSWGNLNPTKAAADMYRATMVCPSKVSLIQGYDSCRSEFYKRDPGWHIPADPCNKVIRRNMMPTGQWPGQDNNRSSIQAICVQIHF